MAWAALVLAGLLVGVWADEEKVALEKLPRAVTDAVKKRFPRAALVKASRETEDGKTAFEVTVKEGDGKIDVTLDSDGIITLLEKEIAAADLPKPVKDALDKKYPKATFKTIEEVIKVKDGKETLDFYEALLETADKARVEVKVGADGKIKDEEKKDRN
jgi:hypothetical protein